MDISNHLRFLNDYSEILTTEEEKVFDSFHKYYDDIMKFLDMLIEKRRKTLIIFFKPKESTIIYKAIYKMI